MLFSSRVTLTANCDYRKVSTHLLTSRYLVLLPCIILESASPNTAHAPTMTATENSLSHRHRNMHATQTSQSQFKFRMFLCQCFAGNLCFAGNFVIVTSRRHFSHRHTLERLFTTRQNVDREEACRVTSR